MAPESPAAEAGVERGDIIKKVNGKEARSALDFYKILNDDRKGEIKLEIYRDSEKLNLSLKH